MDYEEYIQEEKRLRDNVETARGELVNHILSEAASHTIMDVGGWILDDEGKMYNRPAHGVSISVSPCHRPKLSVSSRVRSVMMPDANNCTLSLDSYPMLNDTPETRLAQFVIAHEWGTALQKAPEFSEGDVMLPFDICSFETMFNNIRVAALLLATVTENGEPNYSLDACGVLYFLYFDPSANPYVAQIVNEDSNDPDIWQAINSTEPFWISLYRKEIFDKWGPAFRCKIIDLIRGALIAMESEIAETELVSAPAKLNKARAKKGREPLRDFYTINLAKRYRREQSDSEPGEAGKVRLHFRRGHFANHPTAGRVWRKWCLVGNPDLGWVDHIYKA